MKRTRFILIVAALLVLTLIAAAKDKTVGEQISLWDGPEMTFDANTPFHITHGYLWYYERPDHYLPPEAVAAGRLYFTLEIDGEMQKFDFFDRPVEIIKYPDGTKGQEYWHMWIFNYPDGMEGDHTFVGTYYAPCKYIELVCEKPNDLVVWMQLDVLIHFE